LTGRNFGDLIEDGIVGTTRDSKVPEIWRRWAGISMVAGALGKRVWYDYGAFHLRPNMFIIIVGGPGTGKTLSLTLPFDHVYNSLAELVGTPKSHYTNGFKKAGLARPLWRMDSKITAEQVAIDLYRCRRTIAEMSTMDNKYEESPCTLTTREFATFMGAGS
jgi:Cdc6-like AAA superfamily ATPase